ncbi:coiled-coil domain-containing protein 113-like [Tribolium madens]|uniref:coiled-coil domain-containing protein 113-like n=1 Tax=Tribolium madens TaxID=41895 RepID=UPI001CF73625|nr:coiled-coil domain-containing protein 113-like [Tribolium madens]
MNLLTDKELVAAVQDLERKVAHLKVENGVFYRFLEKNDPQAIQEFEGKAVRSFEAIPKSSVFSARKSVTISAHTGKGMSISTIATLKTLSASIVSRTSSKRLPKIMQEKSSVFTAQGSDINEPKATEKICLALKSDLVMRDLEEHEQAAERAKKRGHVTRNKLIAKMEEFKCRKEDVEKSIEDFATFKETYQPMTLNRFTRFMDEWSKKSRLVTDKYRLRFSSLRTQYHKMSHLLIYKRQIGEHLQEIDFDNLTYANVGLTKKIEQKQNLLIELKKMTGAGNLKLSQLRGTLLDKINEKDKITQKIKDYENAIIKSDIEISKLYGELEEVKEKYLRTKKKLQGYEAPNVLEYIRLNSELRQAKKEIDVWEKRKIIRDCTLMIEIEKMKQKLQTQALHRCWFE